MAVKALPIPASTLQRPLAQTPPCTTAERLHHIEALGLRINGYVQYMSQVNDQKGMSAEAKEKVVLAFYEQIVVLERQLGRIHDAFKLE